MGDSINKISMGQFKEVIDILNPCMDDFLFIFDIKNDHYCISPNALLRFHLPASEFNHVVDVLRKLVYPEDFEVLQEDLRKVLAKETCFHNLQYRWVDKQNRAVWINCRGSVINDDAGKPEYLIGCINEIGKKPKADNVSGLLGESSFQNEIQGRTRETLQGFILRIGIDNFKEINENKGMDYGDMVLHKTAECIETALLPDQKLYKIVADEFIVVDFEGRTPETAHEMYDRIRDKISAFIENNHYEVFFTISAGILNFADVENREYLNLMKLSEFALNKAKETGKNKHFIYNKEDYRKFLRKKELMQRIRNSVNSGFEGFETYFQPIVDIKNKRLSCAETLLRFHPEDMGFVSPAEFIPLLEESGLIIPVGKWVLHQAMKACSEMQKTVPDFHISVNVSYIQVLKSNVLAEILGALEANHLSTKSIMVELTESGFLEANENFIAFCEGLKKYGIPLALDDFGTGYSNFHYLAELYPNTIKIDRTFTLKALNSEYEYRLLQYMVDMTHSIDLKLCIEGIETKEELNRICGINPDYIQGYYFGKPCSFEQFQKDFITEK